MTTAGAAPGEGAGEVLRDQADPLVAWRYWQLSSGLLLRSVTQRRFEWPPGSVLHARCLAFPHPAPAPGCNCGIYGSRDFESLREHGLCLAPAPLVVGEVHLWGRVIDDGGGCRAAHACPARLWIVSDTIGEEIRSSVDASLARYRVPVQTMTLDEAVAGASATMLRFQAMSWEASTTGVDATPSRLVEGG